MNNNRLGCLSSSAIIATLLTMLVVAGFVFFTGSGVFSAGGLNAHVGDNIGGVTSHAEIGNDCAKCHPAPWDPDPQGDRCMRCHAEISGQLADPVSMHGVMMKNKSLTCRACHGDHRGPDAVLTNMTAGTFPHDATGYSLASHRKRSAGLAFTCSDCHGADVTRFDPAVCSTCHAQIDGAFFAAHTQAYGADCRGCHDGLETISKNFDHSRVAFKLEGKHAEAKCTDCHINKLFKGTSSACFSCHQKDDEHVGKFGQDCSACHSTQAWEPATFDHNLSAFKLDGAHTNVVCEKCHINSVFKGTPQECSDCHVDPAFHQGLFKGQACSACHDTNKWYPAKFNLAHPEPTDGGEAGSGITHGRATCRDCHTTNLMAATCTNCHDNNSPGDGGD